MSNTYKLTEYSTVSEKIVIVSIPSTTFAYQTLLDLPSIEEVKKNHAQLGRITKEKGIRLSRKYNTFSEVKELALKAAEEYSLFVQTFNEYREYWASQIVDNTIQCNSFNDFQEGYDLSQKLNEMLYRSTVLSQYIEKASLINNALVRAVDEEKFEDEKSGLTLFI